MLLSYSHWHGIGIKKQIHRQMEQETPEVNQHSKLTFGKGTSNMHLEKESIFNELC